MSFKGPNGNARFVPLGCAAIEGPGHLTANGTCRMAGSRTPPKHKPEPESSRSLRKELPYKELYKEVFIRKLARMILQGGL